jgi:hypothetical protein
MKSTEQGNTLTASSISVRKTTLTIIVTDPKELAVTVYDREPNDFTWACDRIKSILRRTKETDVKQAADSEEGSIWEIHNCGEEGPRRSR